MNSGQSRRITDSELFVGLMSGTSLDGIDAVLADFSAHSCLLTATHYVPFQQDLRERLMALQFEGPNELHCAALLGNELARLYHKAVAGLIEKAETKAASVRAIGCHGQTVRHNPLNGYTLQLGNPALLAELSNICVVADFRSRDMAAGGQGAPLVPAFHEAIFRVPDKHRVVLNLGGIANITDLRPDGITAGFDTGPGNMLLDAWAQRNRGQAYDAGGAWAASGKPIQHLLGVLLTHPFFTADPPKSCGREQFNLGWLESKLHGFASAEDVQATLLELTAVSAATAVTRWCGKPDELVICGGGAHNHSLLKRLRVLLPNTAVLTSDRFGIGPDWVEAMAFAWLARQALHGLAGNMPAVTGAKAPRVLGAIYPR
ncbi:MAG: Anhydro-N-acetylmuramic acid kinase [Rhodocyclaceae bacterium]|nr:MAG: anhydro-N-acetylmuramic acid kinase [Rhodocyclaceae bacterium]MBE7424067.1 anhydro-N-acetylmuramic acid kinase [Zoogloeaceae bacterium]MBV6407686.1 Anhydro-N-acetylmuramic acid kinase [Rhodocyclaceae bacterium]MCK6383382.1 anhydro-N-acetylmuramic acid kinase [Rhodocyclaceae bacterium]CAG0930315.1 Anhydro-N-acetylmuramic acid kinase [Rhodocyclaceae bacterium]